MCDKAGGTAYDYRYCSLSAIGPGVIWPDTSRRATGRPRVLTSDLAERLRPFLRFRHLFRNIYGGQLRWERSTELLAEADEVWPLFQQQMREFKGVLTDLHDGCR